MPATLNPATSSTFELVHQPSETLLHLCYANESSVTPNRLWFDLSNTAVANLAAVSVLQTNVELSGWYNTGNQTVTLTFQPCAGSTP